MQFETERLILREMVPSDFDALYKVWGDRDIMQHYPYTFDESGSGNGSSGTWSGIRFLALAFGQSF